MQFFQRDGLTSSGSSPKSHHDFHRTLKAPKSYWPPFGGTVFGQNKVVVVPFAVHWQ